ncbi:UNVERIFIED_CONTAM: AMP-binding protein, partial [Bacteroidetes bacterium 56_B9]
ERAEDLKAAAAAIGRTLPVIAADEIPPPAATAPGTDLPDADSEAAVLYTSGTTGRPKGAMLSHFNVIHSASVYVACMALTQADRSIAAVPLS